MENEMLKQILSEIQSVKNEMINLEGRIFTKMDADKNQLINAIDSTRRSSESLTDRKIQELENRVAELERLIK